MKLNYVIIYVDDVGAAISFHEKAFGLTRKFVHESGMYAELDTGSTTLSFAHHDMLRMHAGTGSSIGSGNSFEIAFSTDDVRKAFDHAVASGARVLKEPETKEWGQTVAYVQDPFGTIVEICSPMG